MRDARRGNRLVHILTLAIAVIVACGPEKDEEHTATNRDQLRTNPQLSEFAVYASNSIALLDRAQILGGDVGVERAGAGPSLISGFEAALAADSKIDPTRDLLAEDVLLRDRATAGDIEATNITNQFGSYAQQYPLPAMPGSPAVAPPSPGQPGYSVANGQTKTLAAGSYAAVTVNGILNLSGGSYELGSLTLGNDARVQAAASTELHVAGRLYAADRARIEVSGAALTAKDLRVEVSGQNGSTGALDASPKAAVLGNDTVVRALILAPNGTLQTGHRTKAKGAVFARDVLVNLDAKITFEDGLPSGTCGSCDDSNVCTTDACSSGSCTHTPVANGTSCSDDNACTLTDTCQAGACVGNNPVTCVPAGACEAIGPCDPASGSCSHIPLPDGSPCSDENACTVGDRCQAGTCVSGASTPCAAIDSCHLPGTCEPSTGECSSTPAPDGLPCNSGNRCLTGTVCTSGACAGGTSVVCPSPGECETSTCDPAVGCALVSVPTGTACTSTGSCMVGVCTSAGCVQVPAPADTPCNDSNACTQADHCDGQGACIAGAPSSCLAESACVVASCDPIHGCISSPVAAGTPCDTDFNRCNGISVCNGSGQCVSGTAPACVSSDPCVIASCEPTAGCVLTRAPSGTPGCAPSFEPPALDATISEKMFATTAFLYAGPSAIQTGVAPGTIVEKRVAVIRGLVLDSDGVTPRAGATIRVLDHPEFGQTLTRANGEFDLVVNGGTSYVVDVSLVGYLPVQRRAAASRWHEWANIEDVVLTHPETSPDLFTVGASSAQLVHGSVTPTGEDQDAARQAVVLFPANTHITNYAVPEGTPLEVQITEYTRGANGLQRMPGELPPLSGYTYAFSVRFPAADAAGVRDVHFDRDVPIYVDNFTHYPVGETVPVGYYDHARGAWIEQASGRIIKVVAVADGRASLDVTGDGVADTATALDALGITSAELVALATNYGAGHELWRFAVNHFSDWDCNWGFGPPDPAPPPPDLNLVSQTTDCDSNRNGSIIGCESRTLGETLPIVGTPYSLHYDSSRAEGFKERIMIPITDDRELPPTLVRIRVEVLVAGRVLKSQISGRAQPNSYIVGVWDGKDAYGRPMQGSVNARVRLGYEYAGTTTRTTSGFGGAGGGSISGDRIERTVTIWKEESQKLWRAAATPLGFGGWTVDVHHLYDNADNLFKGDGTRRTVSSVGDQIETVAGGGTDESEGAQAMGAWLRDTTSATEAADGTVYFAQNGFSRSGGRVRRISPDNRVTTLAGLAPTMPAVDGMPALHALVWPKQVTTGPDGSIYFSSNDPDTYASSHIWRITNDPVPLLRLVAGRGSNSCLRPPRTPLPDPPMQAVDCGDGASALSATLDRPGPLHVSPDGNIRFLDSIGLRSIASGGTISTLFNDGSGPVDMWAREDGTLFVLTQYDRLVRVDPSGTASYVPLYFPPPPADPTLANVQDKWCGRPHSFYGSQALPLSDGGFLVGCYDHLVHRSPSGGLTAVIGSPGAILPADGGPALRAKITRAKFQLFKKNGDILVFDDQQFPRLRSVRPASSATAGSGVVHVVSADASELYEVGSDGRHLRTLSAHRGTPVVSFGYDPTSHILTSIADHAGNVTTVTRSDHEVVITAPFGQQTRLGLDAEGHLATFANPANEVTQFLTRADGLLTDMADPRGLTHHFEYDGATSGRLILDKNGAPNTPGTRLSISEFVGGWVVTHVSPEDRLTDYEVDRSGKFDNTTTAERRVVYQVPSYGPLPNLLTFIDKAADGATITRSPDGTKISVLSTAPDPRWGTRASFASLIRTDVGFPATTHSMTVTQSRTASTSPASDLLAVTSETHKTTLSAGGIPDATVTRTYTASPVPSWTTTSPAGRQSRTTLDALERPIKLEVLGTDPVALHPIEYHYDAHGRVDRVTQGTRVYGTDYDPTTGWAASTSDPANLGVSYALRDANGRPREMELPGGRSLEMSYDANGNATSIYPPNRPAHGFDYGTSDLLTSYSPPPSGLPTTYKHNLDGQPTHVIAPGMTTLFGYDPFGRLAEVVDARRRTLVTHDARGRLDSVTTSDGVGLTYEWDGSLLSSVAVTGPFAHRIEQTYDNFFRPVTTSIDGAQPATQTYDADGAVAAVAGLTVTRGTTGVVKATALSNVADAFSYSPYGEVSAHAVTGTAGAALWSASYARDAAGRIDSKTEVIDGSTRTERYVYDTAGRLADVFENGATTPAHSFTYDANGNRSDGTYDSQDRQLTLGSLAFTYTPNGERATSTDTSTGAVTRFEYDTEGNLLRVERPSPAPVIEYVIDGTNRRIAKNVNGALAQGFLYAGSRIVAELDASGAVVSRFSYLGGAHSPDVMQRGSSTYRIVKDHLGSIRMVVNAQSGEIAQRLDFDAWGEVVTDTHPGFQPFGFAGGLWDRDTNLVRFGARDYEPATGRWTSKDASRFGGGLNFYAYANSDPVNYRDLTGFEPWWVALDESGALNDVSGFGLGLLDNLPLWVGLPGSPTLGDLVKATGASGCSSSGGRQAGGIVGAIALGAAAGGGSNGGAPFDPARAKRALFLTNEKSLGTPAQRAAEALARHGRGELELPKGLTNAHLEAYRMQALDAIAKTTGRSAEAATRAVQEPRIALIDAILAAGGL